MAAIRIRSISLSALLLAGSTGCERRPPPMGLFQAGKAARTHGVSAFRVAAADSRNLDVALEGRRSGRLLVAATAGTATQRLTLSDAPPIILRSTWDRVEVESTAGSTLLAERDGMGWTGRQSLPEQYRLPLAVLLALDIDLAVQGTSMAFDGKVYAWCTHSCVGAERCAARGHLERCGLQVATCGACLVQEPDE